MLANEKKGITLIALVMTIVILLILAGISIATLSGDNGLFTSAKEAKRKTINAQNEENKILSEYLEEIDKNLAEGEEKEGDNLLINKVKVGDYIKYTPDTASTESINSMITELGTYSGSADNTTSTLTQETGLNWRVLDVKDGQVRLISELPTTSTITLRGYNGYNNAVYLLDKTCKTLYNSSLASNVQNVKIEDVQNKMKITDFSTIVSDYGKTFELSYKCYPSILAQEKGQLGNGTEGKLGLSEQTEIINQTETNRADPLTVKYTYWNKSMTNTDFKDAKYYELFINNGSDYSPYWMSSRSVYSNSYGAQFGLRYWWLSDVLSYNLYNSYGDSYPHTFAFRPIITLNSNVQIDTENSGDGTSPKSAYSIK